jgi:hypothetical protein
LASDVGRKLRRQRVIFYVRVGKRAVLQTRRAPEYYNTLLDQLETEFEHIHRLLLEIFGSGGARVLPMSDLDHFRHYKRFLNPSLNDRFDFDPADGFVPELSIQENCWHSEGNGRGFRFFLDGYITLIVLTAGHARPIQASSNASRILASRLHHHGER